jgi:hypothetical protein
VEVDGQAAEIIASDRAHKLFWSRLWTLLGIKPSKSRMLRCLKYRRCMASQRQFTILASPRFTRDEE